MALHDDQPLEEAESFLALDTCTFEAFHPQELVEFEPFDGSTDWEEVLGQDPLPPLKKTCRVAASWVDSLAHDVPHWKQHPEVSSQQQIEELRTLETAQNPALQFDGFIEARMQGASLSGEAFPSSSLGHTWPSSKWPIVKQSAASIYPESSSIPFGNHISSSFDQAKPSSLGMPWGVTTTLAPDTAYWNLKLEEDYVPITPLSIMEPSSTRTSHETSDSPNSDGQKGVSTCCADCRCQDCELLAQVQLEWHHPLQLDAHPTSNPNPKPPAAPLNEPSPETSPGRAYLRHSRTEPQMEPASSCTGLRSISLPNCSLQQQQQPPSQLPAQRALNVISRGDSLARRLANAAGVPFVPLPEKITIRPRRGELQESAGDVAAVASTFAGTMKPCESSPSLGTQGEGCTQGGLSCTEQKPSGLPTSNAEKQLAGSSRGRARCLRKGERLPQSETLPRPGKTSKHSNDQLSELPKTLVNYGPADSTMKAQLIAFAESVATDDQNRARFLMSRLKEVAKPAGDAMQRVTYYFLEALWARIQGTGLNRYSTFYNAPEEMTESLAEVGRHMPFMQFLQICQRSAFLEAIGSASHIHILDLGLWHHDFWPVLMSALAARSGPRPFLHITKLDAAPGELSPKMPTSQISRAEIRSSLQQCSMATGIPYEYSVVEARLENLDRSQLDLRAGEVLIVNATMRFNTLSDGAVVRSSPRDAALKAVRALQPALVLLGEKNVDANGPFFLRRFQECLQYYSGIFEALDEGMPRASHRRMVFEKNLLGRDIVNVVACEGLQRVSRSERFDKWQVRMRDAGFVPVPHHPALQAEADALLSTYRLNFTAVNVDGALMLTWKGQYLMGCSLWRPAK